MITTTSLQHPTLRQKLMTAHKRAMKDKGSSLHSDTLPVRNGHIAVFWLPVARRFCVYHINHDLMSTDITDKVAQTI